MKVKFLPFAVLASQVAWLGILPSTAQDQPFPVPDSFVDKKDAPAPPNLPEKFQIPRFTRIDIATQIKTPRTPPPADDPIRQDWEKSRLLALPDMKSAVILRDANNVQVTYQWEGGRISNSYQINGVTFWLSSFKNPDYILSMPTPTVLSLELSAQGILAGSPGTSPASVGIRRSPTPAGRAWPGRKCSFLRPVREVRVARRK